VIRISEASVKELSIRHAPRRLTSEVLEGTRTYRELGLLISDGKSDSTSQEEKRELDKEEKEHESPEIVREILLIQNAEEMYVPITGEN